jgi:hypothetical protein
MAIVLQQMDSSIFSSSEAVQEVSVILNAYARAEMNDLALGLSQTLTNHLKPHIGGVTAQAMLNIIRRGVRSQSRPDRYVGGVLEALEISRLEDEAGEAGSSASPYSVGYLSNGGYSTGYMEESRLNDEDDLSREAAEEGGAPARGRVAQFVHEEFSDMYSDDDIDIDLDTRPTSGLGRALVPFSQDFKGNSSPKTRRRAMPMPMGWS